jgi:hypothetical protein
MVYTQPGHGGMRRGPGEGGGSHELHCGTLGGRGGSWGESQRRAGASHLQVAPMYSKPGRCSKGPVEILVGHSLPSAAARPHNSFFAAVSAVRALNAFPTMKATSSLLAAMTFIIVVYNLSGGRRGGRSGLGRPQAAVF